MEEVVKINSYLIVAWDINLSFAKSKEKANYIFDPIPRYLFFVTHLLSFFCFNFIKLHFELGQRKGGAGSNCH
jgi:hypothetical protein